MSNGSRDIGLTDRQTDRQSHKQTLLKTISPCCAGGNYITIPPVLFLLALQKHKLVLHTLEHETAVTKVVL